MTRLLVEIRDGKASVGTLGFLGSEWNSFQAICAASGCRWNRKRGSESRNEGPVESLPTLVRDLGAVFSLQVSEEAKQVLRGAAESGWTTAEEAALVHVRSIEAECQERGLSLWKPFQEDGAVFLAARERALLADQMGVGKTVQVLVSVRRGIPVIVVCPASVKNVWAMEAKKWRPDLRVVVLSGSGSFQWPHRLSLRDGPQGEVALDDHVGLDPAKQGQDVGSLCNGPGVGDLGVPSVPSDSAPSGGIESADLRQPLHEGQVGVGYANAPVPSGLVADGEVALAVDNPSDVRANRGTARKDERGRVSPSSRKCEAATEEMLLQDRSVADLDTSRDGVVGASGSKESHGEREAITANAKRLGHLADIVILNYDILPHEPRGTPEEGTVLVFDEIHALKNRKAKRTERSLLISSAVLAASGRVYGVSGTPLTNRPFDLASVLKAIHSFDRVFVSWKDFLRRMGGSQGAYGIEWSGIIDPTVPTSMRSVMLRREKKDVMKWLPAKTYRDIEVEPSKALARLADGMMEEQSGFISAVDELARLREEIQRPGAWSEEKANEQGDRLLKAATILLGGTQEAIAFEDMSRMHAEMSKVGYAAAIDLIEEYEEQGEPLVVFVPHREQVIALGEREGWGMILGGDDLQKRAKVIADFQAGRLKGIAATIKAGGTGITLNYASNVLFLSLDWTPAENSQAEDRVHRGEQTRGVVITRMVPNHPFVKRLMYLQGWKAQMHHDAISAASVIDTVAQDRREAAQAALQAAERDQMASAPIPTAKVDVKALLARIPAGRYALDKADIYADGGVTTVFWHLDKPEAPSRWAGFAFLKVQRGPETGRFSTIRPDGLATPAAASVLERLAVDPLGASMRYGQEIGECGVCGKALTEVESRERGIGPVCFAKMQKAGVL